MNLRTVQAVLRVGAACGLALHLPAALSLSAATHYVSLESTNPSPPYTNWATAATDIQAAVDAAQDGDTVLVTNGVYATGSRNLWTLNTNVSPRMINVWPSRVVVTNAIRLESVNGPGVTLVDGGRRTNSDGVVTAGARCVYLGNGAVLSGFTLTNGMAGPIGDQSGAAMTGDGGGVLAAPSAVVTNCVISGNLAKIQGGGAWGGTLYNCALTNNVVEWAVAESGFAGGGSGGGAYGSTLYRCLLAGNSTTVGQGGGAHLCVLKDCELTGNWADSNGGGASASVLNDCRLAGNGARGHDGGGATESFLTNCTVISNSAGWHGGGVSFCTLMNCLLRENTAGVGGAAAYSTLYNSTLTGNAGLTGGGASRSALYNCALTGNLARHGGGGAADSGLTNCTLTANLAGSPDSATWDGPGGGALRSTLANCIVYHNLGTSGPQNYDSASTLNHCCTTPLPAHGVGNLASDPQLASLTHLSANSLCQGAGSAFYLTGTDIDGEPWADPPAIGCDEYRPDGVSGPLAVNPVANYTNVPVGYLVSLTGWIDGPAWQSAWDFGDGTGATNQPMTTHAWSAPGDYQVTLRAFNEDHPNGVSATLTVHVDQGVHYVDAGSAHPVPPYTSWATAASNIQDAVDVSAPGTLILVTNGVYVTGGRVVAGALTNRVTVDRQLRLLSVNGPESTVIDGGGVVRCVSLFDGSLLSGFTLTNGRGDQGAGVCSSSQGSTVVSNCLITGNQAAGGGGGAYGGALYNCTLTGNQSGYAGGGACGSTLNNCLLSENSAEEMGGGVSGSKLNNCTLTRNSAWTAGGAYGSTLSNCIVYFNTAITWGANYGSYWGGDGSLNYCCTTPLPTNGVGNIALDPQLASLSHLSANSPCRGAGNAAYVTGVDIDGEPWANPPSIGCDEYHPGSTSGTLTVDLRADYTHFAAGYEASFTALIEGRTTQSLWDFGDGSAATNQPVVTHVWTEPGHYQVGLRALNESYPNGVSTTLTVHVGRGVYYVAAGNANPVPPYTSWPTAATNLQDAVDAAGIGALVLVTNGLYDTGGRAVLGALTNRLAVDKPLKLLSVNGPRHTIIKGYQVSGTKNGAGAIRCVYLDNGALLSGFTLTNGATLSSMGIEAEESGGGVWCEPLAVVSNCVMAGNSAALRGGGAYQGTLFNCALSNNSASSGGGTWLGTLNHCILAGNSAYEGGGTTCGTLNNCVVTRNSAAEGGGGAVCATLNNCTVVGNRSAKYAGGGVLACVLKNCIVYYNTCANSPNYDLYGSSLDYCCTTPLPSYGGGCISRDPRFIDYAHGDLRLQPDSPCINAGLNAWLKVGTGRFGTPQVLTHDLEGQPRVVSDAVDIGAYEYPEAGSTLSYAWLQQYGLPTDGSADFIDSDHDGLNNWQEWTCGTRPNNAQSALRLLAATVTPTNVTVTWQSVAGVSYVVERSTSLTAPFRQLATDIPASTNTLSYQDTNAAGAGPLFYRVGVKEP